MSKGQKRTAISLQMKFVLGKSVKTGNCSKTEIYKKLRIKNSTFSTIKKNRGIITENYERN